MGASLYISLWAGLTGWVPTQAGVWEHAEVELCVRTDAQRTLLSEDEVREAIRSAIGSWGGPASGGPRSCGGIQLSFDDGACSPRTDTRDGQTNVYFRRDWPLSDNVIGFTASTVDLGRTCARVTDDQGVEHRLGCRVGSDIELNDEGAWWGWGGTVGVDLETVVAHELGHLVGLGHCEENQTCAAGEALMFGGYTGRLEGPLEDDDEGFCALYPDEELALGAPCARDGACASGLCRGAPRSVCVPPCDEECAGTCVDGGCVEAGPVLCSSCSSAADCGPGGVCAGGRCRPDCGGGCPGGDACRTFEDGARACVGGCGAPGRAEELASCTDRPCAAGLVCRGRCLRPCAERSDCGLAQTCAPAFEATFCLPEIVESQRCDDFSACRDGPCVVLGLQPVCVRSCVGTPCRSGQTCVLTSVRAGAATRICTPALPPEGGIPDFGPGSDAGRGDAGPSRRPDAGVTESNPSRVPIRGSCRSFGSTEHGLASTLVLMAVFARRRRFRRV